MRIPFQERKSLLRGAIDMVTGCYPGFLLGGRLGDMLPVFHFHDVTVETLDPYLRYLSENGYHTVASDALERLVKEGVSPGEKAVMLCFDDAWASVWTDVEPLLRQYDMCATTYVIPGRVEEADATRAQRVIGAGEPAVDREGPVLATWPEIKALYASGRMDVQAHTYSHAKIFASSERLGFVSPAWRETYLSRPALSLGSHPEFISPGLLGCPLYPIRARMSDAHRYWDDEAARNRCVAHVANHGGAAFFDRSDWATSLAGVMGRPEGRMESDEEREREIMDELVRAREVLGGRLGTHTVRHICLPWGVCGASVRDMLQRAGYKTAMSDRLFGKRFVSAKTDPYGIMRMKHTFIACLPGQGRRTVLAALKG